ncbi:GNAT family N-acetyltransferase [Arthrobacter sp. NPDC090010]|uniref:GNAT family N-acetyltransferase n=1 Tax=Arthrobacter sp. NPDC090010 TaxID=3363942 RepID=UPI0038079270
MATTTMQEWADGLYKGELTVLRGLLPEDLPELSGWWNDSGLAVLQRYTTSPIPTEDSEELFRQWSKNDTMRAAGFSIVSQGGEMSQDGDLVGHITAWGMDPRVRTARIAIMIGPRYQGQGYGGDALRVMLRVAFEEMAAHKVALDTWSFNERALRLYRSLGFVEEGRERDAVFHRSGFHDKIVLGMLESEYRERYGD